MKLKLVERFADGSRLFAYDPVDENEIVQLMDKYDSFEWYFYPNTTIYTSFGMLNFLKSHFEIDFGV
ncbi:MAG TPA: hypothetical protein VJ742_06960 [Nitrososphaera sp.]|nr:hypothetical protein [Nitrososphaera sp.]